MGKLQVDVAVVDGRVGHQRHDDTFEVAYAGIHVLGNVADYIFGEFQSVAAYLVAQNVFAQFEVGLFNFGGQSPLEARDETLFHAFELRRRAVGCHNQLLAVEVQVVEDVEESILCAGQSCESVYCTWNRWAEI